MSWISHVTPNLEVQDEAGFCLRFTQTVFDAPVMYATAWEAWENAHNQEPEAGFPADVSVPVFFSYFADLDGTGVKNWGHVCARIPGRGYLSSPGQGYGQAWFGSLEEVETYFNAKYVGWAQYLNGKPICTWEEDAAPAPTPEPAPSQNVYVVQVDDNLTTIADTLGVNWEKLYADNRDVIGDDPNLIHPGQELVY